MNLLGKERSNKIAVIKTAQANRGVRSKNIPYILVVGNYSFLNDK